MKQMEEIVKELESGSLPLEQAIKKFEQGMKCSGICHRILDETEKKVTILMQDRHGDIREESFDPANQEN